MTNSEFEARLAILNHQIERLIEIDECRTAREQTLRAELEVLKVRADSLTKQIFFLKLETK